jgi:hypothetical protein
VALSDRVYLDTVLQRHTSLQARQFVRVEVAEKEYAGAAWITVMPQAATDASTTQPADGGGSAHGDAIVSSAPEPGRDVSTLARVENSFHGEVRDVGVIGISLTDPGRQR